MRYRVAHIITRLCQGGAQENTFHTVRLANSDRFDVDLISGPTSGAEGSIEDRVREAGIEILREPDLVRPVSPLKDWNALRSLTRRLRSGGYHIVHTHTSKAGVLGRRAARAAGVPAIVHTPHGNIFDGYFDPLRTWVYSQVERRAARWTDRIIELTESGIGEYLQRKIGQRDQYRTIFSGIDLEPYEIARQDREKTRKSLGISPDHILIGGVGRLEPVKGFAYFTAAAKALQERNPQTRFVLAGSGSEEGALRRACDAFGDRFQLLGFRRDVPALMAAFDILVVPSLNEGMGRVILEAGAAETCVVAAAVGGIPDVVRDGETGVLVPPRDAHAIADAVEALISGADRRNRLARNARDHVVPAYSIQNMVAAIEALYNELIEEKQIDHR